METFGVTAYPVADVALEHIARRALLIQAIEPRRGAAAGDRERCGGEKKGGYPASRPQRPNW